MKTKHLFLAIILTCMYMPARGTIYTGVCGAELSWTLNTNDSIVVITGRGEMSNFQFDEDKRSYVKSVVFPEGITRISPRSFSYCDNLQSVELPDSVLSIGNYAFRACVNLKEVRMGKGVRTIESCAFLQCFSLQHLVLSDSLERIGAYAFESCHAIVDTVVFPESLVSIKENAFSGASAPNAVAVWKARHCKSGAKPMNHFTKVIFGENVEYIGSDLFCNAPLDTVILPNGVDTIECRAFYGCSLKHIELPQSLKYIGPSAFDGAASLTSLTVPENVSNIPSLMCYGCSSLKSVTLPEGIKDIKNDAFSNCNSLSNINIPQSVQSIGMFAFDNCRSLTSITFPEGITSISDFAFRQCSSLKEVYFPKSLTSIGEGAFQDCAIDSLDFPASLVTIGEYAFLRLLNLKELFFPDEVRHIKSRAFEGCTALQKVQFGRKISMIDSDAFKGDNRLTEITCNAVVPPLAHSSTFNGVPDTAILIVPSQSIEEYAADEVWGRFRIQQNQELGHVTTETTETTVTFTWPTDENATSYEIDIYKNGTVFCKITFGPKGQLLGIAFSAPGRHEQPMGITQQLTTSELPATLSFMVTGLDEASRYNYVLSTLDVNGTPLHVYIGDFATTGYTGELNPDSGNEITPTPPIIPYDPESTPTGIENPDETVGKTPAQSVRLIICGGELLIQDNGRTYTIQGQLKK
jgi:hypothetical protein